MHKYKANKEGIIVVKQDGVRYKCCLSHPTLPETIEVPKEILNFKDLGLELVEIDLKRKKSEK